MYTTRARVRRARVCVRVTRIRLLERERGLHQGGDPLSIRICVRMYTRVCKYKYLRMCANRIFCPFSGGGEEKNKHIKTFNPFSGHTSNVISVCAVSVGNV